MDSTHDLLIEDSVQGWVPLNLTNGTFVYQYGNVTYNASTGSMDFSVANSDSAGAYALLNTNLRLPAGDFDIRMDFNLTHFSIPAGAGGYTQLITRIVDPALGGNVQSISIGMRERYESPQRSFRGYTTSSAEGDCTYVARPTDCLTSSKIRYIRSGTVVTAYYLTGGVWTALVSKNPCNTTPWEMRLSSGQYSALDTTTSNLSNMIIVAKAADAP